jgi:hypothetical protein
MDKVSLDKDTLVVERASDYSNAVIPGHGRLLLRQGEPGLPLWALRPRRGFLDQIAARDDKKSWYVWVLGGADARWTRQRWHRYRVDGDEPRVARAIHQGRLSVQVSLLDGAGNAIIDDEVELVTRPPTGVVTGPPTGVVGIPPATGQLTWLTTTIHWTARHLLIGPLLSRRYQDPGFGGYTLAFKPAEVYPRKLKVSEAELKRLKEIRCKVVFRPGKDD